jgi:N-acyl-D-amino-acid deacylase
MGEFLDTMETSTLAMNAAFLVGHGTVRYAELGEKVTNIQTSDVRSLCRITRQALREGAYGLSVGLAYAPGVFAANDELLSLLQIVKEENAVFTVHGKAYSWVSPFYSPMIIGTPHNLRSVRELLDLAKRAGVKLQLSHQIFVGRKTWRTHKRVLREIEKAAKLGVDIGFDAFPYTVGNTLINVVFPAWFLDGFDRNINDKDALRKLKKEMDLLRVVLGIDYSDITLLWAKTPELSHLEGFDFAVIAEMLDMSKFDAYIHVARKSLGEARVLLDAYSGDATREYVLQTVLSHPLCAFMTDTILTSRGKHNPASFGTFPRILGKYSRDLNLFPLEDAVHRMTGYSADRIGLRDVGKIKENAWADIVIFDPETIADQTTRDRPDMHPSGIHRVMISGHWVVQDGKVQHAIRVGRLLRRR